MTEERKKTKHKTRCAISLYPMDAKHNIVSIKTDPVTAMCIGSDTNTLITSDKNGVATIRDFTAGDPIKPLCLFPASPASMCFSPDGKFFAGAGLASGKALQILDVAKGEFIAFPDYHESAISHVCFSSDWKSVASKDTQGYVAVWDVASQELTQELKSTAEKGDRETLTREELIPQLRGFARETYHEDDAYYNEMSKEDLLWKSKSHETAGFYGDLHGLGFDRLRFSDDGKRLLSCTRDGVAESWDLATGEKTESSTAIGLCCLSPNGSLRATVEQRNDPITVRVEASSTLSEVWTFRYSDYNPSSLCFSANNKKLAMRTLHGIRVWDLETGDMHRISIRHEWNRVIMCFSSDGKQLAFADTEERSGQDYLNIIDLTTLRSERGDQGVSVSGPGTVAKPCKKDS